eukprot:scaffold39389_cov14-Tisochrysis_lutea.AAC.1
MRLLEGSARGTVKASSWHPPTKASCYTPAAAPGACFVNQHPLSPCLLSPCQRWRAGTRNVSSTRPAMLPRWLARDARDPCLRSKPMCAAVMHQQLESTNPGNRSISIGSPPTQCNRKAVDTLCPASDQCF